MDPYGKFLYTSNQNSNDISAYIINQQNGTLTPVFGSPFPVGVSPLRGVRPREVTVDPVQRFLYLVNRKTDTISAFKINAETGGLTPVSGSPFPPCVRKRLRYWWILLVMVGKSFRPARRTARSKIRPRIHAIVRPAYQALFHKQK